MKGRPVSKKPKTALSEFWFSKDIKPGAITNMKPGETAQPGDKMAKRAFQDLIDAAIRSGLTPSMKTYAQQVLKASQSFKLPAYSLSGKPAASNKTDPTATPAVTPKATKKAQTKDTWDQYSNSGDKGGKNGHSQGRAGAKAPASPGLADDELGPAGASKIDNSVDVDLTGIDGIDKFDFSDDDSDISDVPPPKKKVQRSIDSDEDTSQWAGGIDPNSPAAKHAAAIKAGTAGPAIKKKAKRPAEQQSAAESTTRGEKILTEIFSSRKKRI